jgi:hypothetical protein
LQTAVRASPLEIGPRLQLAQISSSREFSARLCRPHFRKASEAVEKSETCHAERSEASPQFFVSSWNNSNCGDPSLRSG